MIVVPCGQPVGSADDVSPPSMRSEVPVSASAVLVISSTLDTADMLASASPLNHSVDMALRSLTVLSLLVAWRLKASSVSSDAIPHPLSVTLI